LGDFFDKAPALMANVKDALGEAVNEHGVIGTNRQKSKVYGDAAEGVYKGF
jgi:hypothetical protein